MDFRKTAGQKEALQVHEPGDREPTFDARGPRNRIRPLCELKLADKQIEVDGDPDVQDQESELICRAEISNQRRHAAPLKDFLSPDGRDSCGTQVQLSGRSARYRCDRSHAQKHETRSVAGPGSYEN